MTGRNLEDDFVNSLDPRPVRFEEMIEKWKNYSVIGEKLRFQEWAFELPFIKWPPEYYIKAVPNYCATFVRYHVSLDPKELQVSVFLDCLGMLGSMPWPFWEVMSMREGGEYERCKWDDIEGEHGLLSLIRNALEKP